MPRPASDDSATADTAGVMAFVIQTDAGDELVRQAAALATSGVARSPEAQVRAVHRWVRSHVRFREDSDTARQLSGIVVVPEETEVLIRPADLLRMTEPAGDCDDFTMLTGAMLTALGIPVALVTIAADPHAPDTYSHVYLIASTPSGAMAVDASHGPAASWYAPAAGKAKIWEVSPLTVRANLGAIDWNSIIQTGVKAGAQIAQNVTLPQGYYSQTGQGITMRQQPGASAFSLPNNATGAVALSSGVILLGLAGIAVLLFMTRNHK